jgi:hypothetical protein
LPLQLCHKTVPLRYTFTNAFPFAPIALKTRIGVSTSLDSGGLIGRFPPQCQGLLRLSATSQNPPAHEGLMPRFFRAAIHLA